jgi:PrcB C-terminal
VTRILPLTTLALLVACGSGTIRPTDDAGGIAPAPSPAPSPPVVDPDPAATPAPAPEAPDGPSEARPDTTPGTGSEVEIRRVGRWISSGIKGARRLVIREQGTWSRFWAELGAGAKPRVDFSKDLVIAVASGERSRGGHGIVVRRVSRSGGQLRIEVLETSPGPTCMATTALTQPVDVVLVPTRGVTGWSFIDRTATSAC